MNGERRGAALILCDSGPLFATLDQSDSRHADAVEFFRRTREAVAAPSSVVFEVAGLASHRLGARIVAGFAESVASGELPVVEVEMRDMARAASVVRSYADTRLGLVDATLIALAERLGVRTIASFDWRHLGVVRPLHGRLTLVP